MPSLLREPECVVLDDETVEVQLCFADLPDQGHFACGVRTSPGGERISRGMVITADRCVRVELDVDRFEAGEDITIAVKLNGQYTPDPPDWDLMEWSWEGRFKAEIVEGKPTLTGIG